MSLRRWWLLFSWLIPCAVLAQEASEQQVESMIRRGEQLLVSGQPKQALQSTRKLTALLLAEGALNYPQYTQLLDRATVLSATAIVRLAGRDPTRPSADPRKNLEQAEQRFVELLTPPTAEKPNHWRSRHGEALVALGRYEEAASILTPLLTAAKLTEPEGAAALAEAATQLSNKDLANTAAIRCHELAKKRAKQICRR